MLIGYARVSTDDQNLALQRDALGAATCERIFEDTISGSASSRPGLDEALAFARSGDTLVVWKLDRLGRTVTGLIELVDSLPARDIQFRRLTDGIDTSSSQGRFFFHVVGAFAELERDLIRERTRAGLAAARAGGKSGGRPRAMTSAKLTSARHLLASGQAPRA